MKKNALLLLMLFVGTALVNAQCPMGVKNLKGNYIDDNKVCLTWMNEDVGPYWGHQCDIVTGDNFFYKSNGWYVSTLHSGLGSLGFNADKDAGFKIMDKFTSCYEVFYLRFYLYEGATPFSTIDGAYLTIYDGDPLDGGNVIAGGDGENRLVRTGSTNIYRTKENDITDVSRPVFYVDVDATELEDNYEENTFWFEVSFTGTLNDDVYIVPRTVLGETTTGEARIFTEESGWMPMLDENTHTQQGVALETLGYGDSGGAVGSVDTCNIYRNGELVYKFAPKDYIVTFIDEDAPDGNNTYGVQNVFTTDCEGLSSIYCTEVRKSFPPKNFEYDSEEIEDDMIVYHLTWEREDDMGNENIATFYEIYRKKISEDEFTLIKSIAKIDGMNVYDFYDTVNNEICYYNINTYNVYETGSSESELYSKIYNCEAPANLNAVLDENTGMPVISWGDIKNDTLKYDAGEFKDEVDVPSDYECAMRFDIWVKYTQLTDVMIYSNNGGEYEVKICGGDYISPDNIIGEFDVVLEGNSQWNTISVENPLSVKDNGYIWIILSNKNESYNVTYSEDVDEECCSYVNRHGTWWELSDLSVYGEFMIRPVFNNMIDANELVGQDEPDYGLLNYVLYRSEDNVVYEQVAQISNPSANINRYNYIYKDMISDNDAKCYYYKVTSLYKNIDEQMCESTPATNMFDPNLDWAEICVTSVVNNEYRHAKLYPNPTSSTLHIDVENFFYAEFYDMMGRIVGRFYENVIDMSDWKDGMYFVRIFDDEYNNSVEKVVKD